MYTIDAFAEDDLGILHDFIRGHGFALLVTGSADGLVGSHLPMLLDADAGGMGVLIGHMARANPQWRSVEGGAMAVFQGPHAYVSPSWYGEPGTVPTWNYVAVHAYGTFRVVEDREGLLDILGRSVAAYEGARAEPWAFDPAAPGVEGMLRGIVGFRIEIARIEGKWKLSQNHPERRRRKVIEALAGQPGDDARAVARLMEEATGRDGGRSRP